MTERKLTAKEADFIREYLIDRNATQAAIRAGYSENTAKGTACKLLKRPGIAEHIQKAMDERAKRTEITADRVLEEIARIAFIDVNDIMRHNGGKITIEDFENLTPAQRSCIAGIKQDKDGMIEIKLYDKLNALEKLGKHLKLFTDVQQVNHTFTQMGRVQIGNSVLEFQVGAPPDKPLLADL